MDKLKAEMERVREKRKSRREKRRREKSRRKKIQVREKVGKSRNTMFFQWFVAPGGRKVGSLKRRVRSQLARWDEELHAVVARSTFPSQNVQNTSVSDRFWKLRCRKSVRRCGTKHISKSKCTKHISVGPLLEVQVSFRMAGARDCAPCRKSAKREGFVAYSTYNHHYTTLRSNTLHYNYNLHYNLHYIPLHYATLHSTTLHYTTLNYTEWHRTTLHYTTSHNTTLHCIPLHYTTLHYTTLHYTTLHYTTFHYTTLHYIPLHFITLHYTTLHLITLHYTRLHYTTPHHTTLHETASF